MYCMYKHTEYSVCTLEYSSTPEYIHTRVLVLRVLRSSTRTSLAPASRLPCYAPPAAASVLIETQPTDSTLLFGNPVPAWVSTGCKSTCSSFILAYFTITFPWRSLPLYTHTLQYSCATSFSKPSQLLSILH